MFIINILKPNYTESTRKVGRVGNGWGAKWSK